MKDEMTGATWM